MDLFEARREGYITALKDLHKDGILSLEEFRKREAEQLAKQYTRPFASTFFGDTPLFGAQTNTSPFGGPGSFSFGSTAEPSPNLSAFDLRAEPNSTPFTFGLSPSKSSNNDTAFPSFSFPASGSDKPEQDADDEVDELAAQIQSSTLQVRDFVIKEGMAVPVSSSGTIPAFKICIVGDGGVGKTSWISQLKTGTFDTKYVPTVGVEVMPVVVTTNYGPVCINAWDVAGQEKFGGLRDGYFTGSNAYVIMFDVTSRVTYKNVPNWYRDVTRENCDRPVVLVGNKCELKERKVRPKEITFHRKKGLQYYDMSVKSCYNIEKPFLHLLRMLIRDPDLHFVSATDGTALPEVPITNQQIAQYEEELKRLETARPLLDDDEI